MLVRRARSDGHAVCAGAGCATGEATSLAVASAASGLVPAASKLLIGTPVDLGFSGSRVVWVDLPRLAGRARMDKAQHVVSAGRGIDANLPVDSHRAVWPERMHDGLRLDIVTLRNPVAPS